MAISVTQQTALSKGNSSTAAITATLTGVVAEKWLIAPAAAYNTGDPGDLQFSDDKGNPWVTLFERETGFDPFSVALGATRVVVGGTVQVSFAPAPGRYPTFGTVEINAPFNSVWSGGITEVGSGSTVAITGPTPISDNNIAVMVFSWYGDENFVSAVEAEGWTLFPGLNQSNFSSETQTVSAFYKIQTDKTIPAFNAPLGIGSAWTVGIDVLNAPPEFDAWAGWVATTTEDASSTIDATVLVGDDSDPNNPALTHPLQYPPMPGTKVVVMGVMWKTGEGGAEITAGMISDNTGDVDPYVVDRVFLKTEGISPENADANTPTLVCLSRTVQTFVPDFGVTLTPGGGGAYMTWSVHCDPHIPETDYLSDTAIDYKPDEDSPGTIPPILYTGEATATTTKTRRYYGVANRGHKSQDRVDAPTEAKTALKITENSLTYSLHTGTVDDEVGGDLNLEFPVTHLDGPNSVIASRGFQIVYLLNGGEPIGGEPQELIVTPEGGITFGGAATVVRGRVSLPVGVFTWGGAASVTRGRVSIPEGGTSWGGTATVLRGRAANPSGGITWGGAATVQRERISLPTGGITWAGAANVVRGRVHVPTGGIAWAGAAVVARGASWMPSGGLVWSGAAIVLRGRVAIPVGGVVWGGAADIDTEHVGAQELVWIPSGGIVWGGSAQIIRTRVVLPSSGILWGGSASIVRTRVVEPLGGLVFGGVASIARGIAHMPTGGLTWGGSVVAVRGRVHLGQGGIAWGGSGVIVRSRIMIPLGGFIWRGAALIEFGSIGQTPIDSTPDTRVTARDAQRQIKNQWDRRIRRSWP